MADFYNENRDRDYSGLTTLFNEQKVSDAEVMASAFVNSFESKYKTKELWDKINMATSRQLAISEDGGMISAATHKKIEDMFSYYIPLRGFKEDISEDMYDYMGEGTAGPCRSHADAAAVAGRTGQTRGRSSGSRASCR